MGRPRARERAWRKYRRDQLPVEDDTAQSAPPQDVAAERLPVLVVEQVRDLQPEPPAVVQVVVGVEVEGDL